MNGAQSAFFSKFSGDFWVYLKILKTNIKRISKTQRTNILFLAESYLQSLAAMNGLAAAAEQQQAQSPSSPAARPSNSATPQSANNEETSAADKNSNGTDESRNNNNVNAMFASAMQQFLQQQQYLNSANAWFGSQMLQKQLASPAGSNAFVFPPPGLAAFMPTASMASSVADPLSNDSTPTTNGSNNVLSAFLAANPMNKGEKAEKTEEQVAESPKSTTPVEKNEEQKAEE